MHKGALVTPMATIKCASLPLDKRKTKVIAGSGVRCRMYAWNFIALLQLRIGVG